MGIGGSKTKRTQKLVQDAVINSLHKATQSCAQQGASQQNFIITGSNNKLKDITLSQFSQLVGGCLNNQEVKQEFMQTLNQTLKDISENKQKNLTDVLGINFEVYDSGQRGKHYFEGRVKTRSGNAD